MIQVNLKSINLDMGSMNSFLWAALTVFINLEAGERENRTPPTEGR